MADVLDKIRKLMALAASPNENEARTAALLAVKLMGEHKVELRLPVAARQSSAFLDSFWDDFLGKDAHARYRDQYAERPPRSPYKDLRSTVQWDPFAVDDRKSYTRNCVVCGKDFTSADRVVWSTRYGTAHLACEWGL
jgi:uncharacterized protein DUF2786